MAGLHVLGKFFLGKIFLEISNDAVQRFCHAVNWTNLLANLNVWEKKFAQRMFIFAQFLEKFAQKQNVPKFLKNLPSFQKLVIAFQWNIHSKKDRKLI